MPSKRDKALYFLFYVIYIIQISFSSFFLYKIYKPLVKLIYHTKENEIILQGTGSLTFWIFSFFPWIIISWILLKFIFSLVFGMSETFEYYAREEKKNYHRNRYSLGSYKADQIFVTIIEVAAVIFMILSLHCNLRITENCIYTQKFFSIHSDKIFWNEINSLDFYIEQSKSKEGDITPKLVFTTSQKEYKIFDGFGIGNPSIYELQLFKELLVQKNPSVKIQNHVYIDSELELKLMKYKSGIKTTNQIIEIMRN